MNGPNVRARPTGFFREAFVVDLEERTRKSISVLVENNGFRVFFPKNVASLPQLIRERMPHLLILDVTSLGRIVITYLEKHVSDPLLGKIPVIVVGNPVDKKLLEKAVSLGVVDTITRPLETVVISRKLRAIMDAVDYPSRQLSSLEQAHATLGFSAKIIASTDNGFILEAPVKIATRAQVRMTSEHLKNLGLDKAVFVRTSLSSVMSIHDYYNNDMVIAGMGSDVAAVLATGVKR